MSYSLAIPLLLLNLIPLGATTQTASQSSGNDELFSALDTLSDQLVQGDRYLGRPRVTVSPDHVVRCDVSPDQAALAASNDVVTRSLDILIRAKVLRRDLTKIFPDQTFWDEPLNAVYSAVKRLNSSSNQPVDAASTHQSMAEIESQFRKLEDATVSAAAQKHLDVESAREGASPFQVEVRIKPPKARVRCMPLLTYLRCTKLGGAPALEMQWIDLTEGKTSLIGKYRYLAEWPPELNGTVEGNFEIDEDKILTFVPRPAK